MIENGDLNIYYIGFPATIWADYIDFLYEAGALGTSLAECLLDELETAFSIERWKITERGIAALLKDIPGEDKE